MGFLDKYSDEELISLIDSDLVKEMRERGYAFGWHKETEFAGVIYILVNPAFPNLVKIGYADDLEKRLKVLNRNSGLPDPFHVYAAYKVKKRLEDLKLHDLIDSLDSDLRHSSNREFYEMTAKKAYDILSAIAEINGNDDVLMKNPFNDPYFDNDEATSKEDLDRTIDRMPSLTFAMIDIPVGSELVYVKDSSIVAKTIDLKNKVEYKGKIYSLSGLAREIRGTKTEQGPVHFTYNGKLLTEIRKEKGV